MGLQTPNLLLACHIFITYLSPSRREPFWDKAQVYLERAFEIDPDHAEALYFSAWLEERRGNLASAIEIMEKAIQVSPNFADAHAQLARFVYRLTGNNEKRKAELAIQLERIRDMEANGH